MRELSRRQILTNIAVTGTGLFLPRHLFAAEDMGNNLIGASDICVLTPEVTEGPYYLVEDLVRRDITEGKPGVPMTMRMQIVDASCRPLPNARVDLWHCDAQGIYSSFGGSDEGETSTKGETFLRGTQFADKSGIVEFETIYPGWYRGRTTHIHYKVFLDETNILTGQIFFPDALSSYLYENAPDYAHDGSRDTINASDGIAAQATRASYAAITEGEAAYLAQLIVGVSPDAISQDVGMPGGGPRPGEMGEMGGTAPEQEAFSVKDLLPGNSSD